MNHDEFQVQVTVKGRSTDDNYYAHTILDFEVGETSEYEAMQIARAAVMYYINQHRETINSADEGTER